MGLKGTPSSIRAGSSIPRSTSELNVFQSDHYNIGAHLHGGGDVQDETLFTTYVGRTSTIGAMNIGR